MRRQPKELGQRSRAELEAMFGQMYAGWDRGVNMEGPDTGFRETPMTPMELEARYVATEIGINIFEIAGKAAFAPVIVYNTIQKFLGPVFARTLAFDGRRIETVLRQHWLTGIKCDEATKTDVATCYCTVWRSQPMPSVAAAVNEWINHVLIEAAAIPSDRIGDQP